MAIDDQVYDCKAGLETRYTEDRTIYRVRVLENNGNEKWEAYKLKILEIIRDDLRSSSKVGDEFSVSVMREYKGRFSGNWHLGIQ